MGGLAGSRSRGCRAGGLGDGLYSLAATASVHGVCSYSGRIPNPSLISAGLLSAAACLSYVSPTRPPVRGIPAYALVCQGAGSIRYVRHTPARHHSKRSAFLPAKIFWRVSELITASALYSIAAHIVA